MAQYHYTCFLYTFNFKTEKNIEFKIDKISNSNKCEIILDLKKRSQYEHSFWQKNENKKKLHNILPCTYNKHNIIWSNKHNTVINFMTKTLCIWMYSVFILVKLN